MHNLHLVVTKADNAQDACDYVESQIQDFGNDNNWRTICGCLSSKGKAHDQTDPLSGRWSPHHNEFNTLAKLNKMVEGWMKPDYESQTAREKIKKGQTNFSTWNTGDLASLKRYVSELQQIAKLKQSKKGKVVKGFNVLKDELYPYQYTEMGVTQMEGDGKETFVVFVDMHD